MSIADVIEKISNDDDLSEKFCDLADLDEVKEFIKEIDSSISDEEIEKFINDTVFQYSELSMNELQNVAGGAMNKKFLSLPLALLSAISIAGSSINTDASAATLAPRGGYSVKYEQEKKYGLGKRILQKVKSDAELKKSVDEYKLNGFINEPTKTDLSDNMGSRRYVFFDTLHYCAQNRDKFGIEYDKEDFTSKGSKTVNYDHKKFMEESKNDKVENKKPAKIWLTNGRSLQSLNAVNAKLGIDPKDVKNTAVLNFANYFVPGGGVLQGCTAQEESLCRVSTLYGKLATKAMKKEFYGKHKIISPKNMDEWKKSGVFNEAIYTTGVKQIKEDYGIGRIGEYVDGATFNVITAAAPDFREFALDKNDILKYKENMKDLWRMILATAYKNGDKNLVLGALGCGAFRNDPNLVAEAFYDVITEAGPGGNTWACCFDNIIIPLFTFNKRDQKNYDAFKKVYDEKYKPISNESQEEIELPSIS